MSSSTSDDQNYIALAKLHSCVQHPGQQIDYIQELVNSNFDINYAVPRCCPQPRLFGYTALHFAVERGFEEFGVKLLLSHGADFTRKNDKGFTPLRLAYELVKGGRYSILSAHREFDNATNPCCNNGISHFHIACLTSELEVVKFFLKNGVSVDQAIKSGEYAGCTGLHLAALNEKVEMVTLLLKEGADSTHLNAKGQTPLHVIIEKQLDDFSDEIKSLYKDMMEVLLRSTLKYSDSVDHIGLSCLHVYCTVRYSSVLEDCKMFLNDGVDVNASIKLDSRFCPGYTPLHFAARCNLGTFKFLLENGANLYVKDANGATPLDLCLQLHDPINVIPFLNTNEIFKFIEFENNEKLKVSIERLSDNDKLDDYLRNKDPNAVLSSNSPLWPGITLLHLAVKLTKDNTSKVEWLLSNGADPTIQDASGMSPLHMAFYLRKTECIEEILNRHIDTSVNPVDNSGLSHFHISCITGHKEAVAMFLTSGEVDPNVLLKTDVKPSLLGYSVIKADSTPLHIAAITSNSWLAKLLLENGADPNLRDADGLTWMHRLFGCKSFDFKEILSMPQNLPSNSVTAGGLSHLHVACYIGSEEAVKAQLPLLSTTEINRPIVNELRILLGELPIGTCLGDTPLHLASRANFVVIAYLLFIKGADIGAKNAEGLNPMHVALINRNDSVIKCLTLEYCHRKMWPDEYGLTQLHIACALKNELMIEKMLESGENVNSQIKEDSPIWPGDTPMHVLIRAGYPIEGDAIRLLLDYILSDIEGAVFDNRPSHESVKRRKLTSPKKPKLPVNFEGLSALHVSCMLNDLDIVKKFLKLEVDFDTHTDFLASQDPGFYPLHFAVKYSSDDVVELLLKNKINIDSQDAFGNTPLHVAAAYCHEKLLLFLRANESNVTKKNVLGESIMDLFLREMKHHVNFDCTLNLLENGLAKDPDLDISTKAKLITQLGTLYKKQNLELLIRNIPIQNDVDDEGRNLFHYIDIEDELSQITFSRIAKKLIDNGCELDHRDKEGQTVLHRAMISVNIGKVIALLFHGADINTIDISDFERKTDPVRYTSNPNLDDLIKLSTMKEVLWEHTHKLKLANLYICPSNSNFSGGKHFNLVWQRDVPLSAMEEQIITKSFTLRKVLTEEMVLRFPIMPKYQRQAILQCLDSAFLQRVYPDWMPLFNMQRRKALQMERLFVDASKSLRCLLGPRLPDHCLDYILTPLSAKDWQNVISAANGK